MVSITAAGKKQIAKMRTMIKDLEDSFLVSLDDDERATLQDYLQRIAASNDHRFG